MKTMTTVDQRVDDLAEAVWGAVLEAPVYEMVDVAQGVYARLGDLIADLQAGEKRRRAEGAA